MDNAVKIERKGVYQGVPQWGITGSSEMTPSKATAIKWAALENGARNAIGRTKLAKQRKAMRCDQCEAAIINGVFCHEQGCPNTKSRYDTDSQTWIKQRKCFECGCTVDADDECCNAPMDEEVERGS